MGPGVGPPIAFVTVRTVETYDLAEAAERSGLSTDELGRLVEPVGPVELKGVSGALCLRAASQLA